MQSRELGPPARCSHVPGGRSSSGAPRGIVRGSAVTASQPDVSPGCFPLPSLPTGKDSRSGRRVPACKSPPASVCRHRARGGDELTEGPNSRDELPHAAVGALESLATSEHGNESGEGLGWDLGWRGGRGKALPLGEAEIALKTSVLVGSVSTTSTSTEGSQLPG